MRKLALIPCWFLTVLFKPWLPGAHPWKHQKCSLQWWTAGATREAVWFGAVMWFVCICAALALLILAIRSR